MDICPNPLGAGTTDEHLLLQNDSLRNGNLKSPTSTDVSPQRPETLLLNLQSSSSNQLSLFSLDDSNSQLPEWPCLHCHSRSAMGYICLDCQKALLSGHGLEQSSSIVFQSTENPISREMLPTSSQWEQSTYILDSLKDLPLINGNQSNLSDDFWSPSTGKLPAQVNPPLPGHDFGSRFGTTSFSLPDTIEVSPLPEDYLLQGEIWTQTLFHEDWWKDVEIDPEKKSFKSIAHDSTVQKRVEDILNYTHHLAPVSVCSIAFLGFD